MEQVFTRIYQDDHWQQGSGPGSSAEATRPYRYFLEGFLRSNPVRSVLDVGCGDWRFSRYVPWEGIRYMGLEVVRSLVEANTRQFGGDEVRFLHGDARTAELPPADLVLLKDVLQHWTNAEVAAFLPKLDRFPLCLITNTTNRVPANRDCETGGYRYLDLTRPPFSLAATAVLRYTASRPGEHVDEKTVLLYRAAPSLNLAP